MKSPRPLRPLETVVKGMTRQILAGEFAPGDRLPTEPQLQERWQVSRSVVREAMKVLASQGLVRIEQGRGTFVEQGDTTSLQRQIEWALRRPTAELLEKTSAGGEEIWPTDVWDNLLDVRRVLELAAAERAASRATEGDIEAMEAAINTMRARPGDATAHWQSDLAFHRALAAATQNPLWVALLASFNDLLARYFDFSYHGRDNALSTAGEHQAILAAVQAGDAAGAVAAMRLHLQSSEHDLGQARRQKRVPAANSK